MVLTGNRGNSFARLRRAAAAAALFIAAFLSVSALAQEAAPVDQQPAQPQQLPAAQTPPRAFQPGFIHALGSWLDRSRERLNDQLKDARDTLGSLGGHATDTAQDAAGVAKDAATTIVGLPATRIVGGRERCMMAPNGAPDCRTAADTVCKTKGFGSGRSLDTASAQKCPAQVWLSGRQPAEGECTVETFVTRAVCQ